jgi:uncharacterized protein (UPF0261 family)
MAKRFESTRVTLDTLGCKLNQAETELLAKQLAEKLNRDATNIKILIPLKGWSEADREHGPLFDPPISRKFVKIIKQDVNPQIEIIEVKHHINDAKFAETAAKTMDEMVKGQRRR